MKVGIISGSARKGNNTLRVAKAIQKELNNGIIVDFQEYDLPNFAEGWVAPDSETSFQQHLIKTIDEANLLIVLTPEYNWFPSAEVINMIHQLAGANYKHILIILLWQLLELVQAEEVVCPPFNWDMFQ